MGNKTHKKQRSAGIFGVLPLVWAMGLSAAIPAAFGFWILFTTGPWGIPLFLTYLCLMMMPTAYLISRRENNNRRFLVGEEIYFSENPLLREKALRKKRKEGIPAELQQCLESLRKELPDLEEETDEACEKLQKRNAFLFFAAALLLLGLAAFLFWRGWNLYQAAPASSSQKTDFTPLFPLAGGMLVLATAIFHFMKKKKKLLHFGDDPGADLRSLGEFCGSHGKGPDHAERNADRLWLRCLLRPAGLRPSGFCPGGEDPCPGPAGLSNPAAGTL